MVCYDNTSQYFIKYNTYHFYAKNEKTPTRNGTVNNNNILKLIMKFMTMSVC